MISTCRVCGKEFDKTTPSNRCRQCSLEYRREYGRIHAKELCEKQKQYALVNAEKIRQRTKPLTPEQRQRNIERSRKFYQDHREELLKRCSEYGKANRVKNREYERTRKARRIKNDPAWKIESNLRCRMYMAMKNQATTKKGTFERLVGCTRDELARHLESLFQQGMTWENKGRHGWHIDHIRPCASFDLTDLDNQRECFHYTNLQPLWWFDNLSKGSKVM